MSFVIKNCQLGTLHRDQLVRGFALSLLLLAARGARADRFAVVPAGDAAYAELATVAQAGWVDPADMAPGRVGGDTTLTRYEVSLEVARALLSVASRADAEPSWGTVIPRKPARALRDLTAAYRVELKGLGVDVAAAEQQLDASLKPSARAFGAHSQATAATHLSAPRHFETISERPAVTVLNTPSAVEPALPISQRLRVSAAVSALARDADDMFGDAAFGATGGLARKGSVYVPGAVPTRAGVAVGVTDWLTLRASYGRQHLSQPQGVPSLLASSRAFSLGQDSHAAGGSVDIALPRNLTLSGGVENVAGDRTGSSAWRQLGGQLGWTGWQNRLSLKANMSRLVPDDARLLPSTLFGLNVGLDLNQRLSLTLLYQQMFSAPTTAEPNQLMAGGVSIHF